MGTGWQSIWRTAPRTARVFLSYKRNVESDGALADQVVALSAAGHLIFIDKQLRVGQDWAAEIDGESASRTT